MQFYHHRLDEGSERDRVVDPRLSVADAELERVEERMEPNVPPDLFRVIDAVGIDQDLEVILVLRETLEGIGNPGAREAFENIMPIGLEAGILAEPEG